MAAVFDTLYGINVNDHTEKKTIQGTNLTYLSWTWAWAEIKKRYPDASYEIRMFDGLPYVYDANTGYMVFTTVTIGGSTHEMWLPVMDGNNRAMKADPYTVKTKYKEIEIAPATMFDINKTIMRCLVKNLAMFGLGLYIYAGEDLPEVDEEQAKAEPAKVEPKKAEPAKKKQAEQPKQQAVNAPAGPDKNKIIEAIQMEYKRLGRQWEYAYPIEKYSPKQLMQLLEQIVSEKVGEK